MYVYSRIYLRIYMYTYIYVYIYICIYVIHTHWTIWAATCRCLPLILCCKCEPKRVHTGLAVATGPRMASDKFESCVGQQGVRPAHSNCKVDKGCFAQSCLYSLAMLRQRIPILSHVHVRHHRTLPFRS